MIITMLLGIFSRNQAYNKSRCKQAILRGKKSSSDNECYDLEIWNELKKENTFELSDHKDHGKINTNSFSCLSWSSDDKYLLYTAEAKQAKSSSYFKVSKTDDEDSKKEDAKNNQGKEYIYREEWGEDFVGSHHSVLVILEISSGKTKIVSFDDIDNQLSIGEAIWGPNDKTIILIGYDEFPQRLGFRSCTNRRSAIYLFDCESSTIDCVSNKDAFVRHLRFSPDFKNLFYLETTIGGPHSKGYKLQKVNINCYRIFKFENCSHL